MKFALPPLLLSLFTLTSLQTVWSADRSETPDVEQLIDELSSESFKERQDASRKLWELGSGAVQLLRQASKSDDPERAFRASELLEKLELRITPDTSEDILALIAKYRKAARTAKSDILSELKVRKAYFQMLKLYSMESPNVRAELASAVRGVAISGAREAIIKDDVETAIQLLRISGAGYEELRALANVYRNTGRIDDEINNPNPPENVSTDLWKLTLLRAKGDLEGGMKLAAEMKQVRLLAAMKVLSGDPTLWLEQNGMGDRRAQAPEAYIDIALKKWNVEEVVPKDLAPLEKLLQSREDEVRRRALAALASLGRLDLVEKVQIERSPTDAFAYYLSRENVPEALKSIGLDPENPDYGAWIRDRFKSLKAGNGNGDNMAGPEIVMLAGFMERRGLYEEMNAELGQVFAEYASENENDYLDLMGSLFESTYGAPRFAADQISKWAGDDEARWNEVFSVAIGEEDDMQVWLNWINETEPGLTERKTLDIMLALFQRSITPGDLRAEWLAKAWGAVEKAENKELKQVYIERILGLTVEQQDVGNSLKAWDMLDPDKQAANMWNSMDRFLSAAGRWEEAADVLLNSGNSESNPSPEVHAYLAVNLRKAGLEERAREHDALAEKLALGDPLTCERIAGYYSYGGDYERALSWQKQAATQASVSRGEFAAVLDEYTTILMRLEKWETAASCQEALVQLYASQQYSDGALSAFAKARLTADLAKAMVILPEQKERAVELLEAIHDNFLGDGILADDFFPLLRKSGLTAELESWFEESWQLMEGIIKEYPDSHNSINTAAWFASRAGLKLDVAEKYLSSALELAPEQPAYLDTMAELQFAKGNREKAIEYSNKAVGFSPFDDMIRLQNHHFKNDPLPR